ncbi:uncharacterized protein LOC110281819 isoform X2 [Arachis duranensis]|uniref:Uncharacterized protein LOC110281819 isoform X2 n=1 Tax=Arachis duranensis TaxID=130453 RepID=A0A6P5NV13_ARADU|nr:uncharacterized protein LOC110281819 isoform X2 [Arachis duranensis]
MTRTNREMVQIFFYSRLPFLLLSFVFTFHCAKFPWQYVTKSAFIFNFLPGSTLYCQWMAELLNDTVSALAKRYKRKIFGSVRTPRDHPDHGRGKKDPPPFSWHASELLIPHREVWLGNSIALLPSASILPLSHQHTPTAYESLSAHPLLSAPLASLRRGLVVPHSVMGSSCIHVSPSSYSSSHLYLLQVGLLEYWIKNNHCGAEGSMQSRILSSLGNGFMDKMEHIVRLRVRL